MGLNPMEIKTNMINDSIEDVKSGNKKQKLRGIEFLGKTIGVGDDFGLKSKAVNVIEACLSDKNRRIRKAAEEALKLIKQREPTSMFDYFQGGVVTSSKKKE